MTAKPMVLSGALLRIPIDLVAPGPNARGDLGDVNELAVSIAAIGLQLPLVVEQHGSGGFRLIDGHRRLAACRMAKVKFVDAVLRKAPGEAERIVRQLAMHAQARDFSPMAEAKALHHLMWDLGMSREEIARQIGKRPEWVRDRLALLQLSEHEQTLVERREMPLTEARGIVQQRRAERDGTAAPKRHLRRHCTTCSCEGRSDPQPKPPAAPRVLKGCPSEAAYRRHLRNDEQCQPCREFMARVERQRRLKHPEWSR